MVSKKPQKTILTAEEKLAAEEEIFLTSIEKFLKIGG